MSNISNNYATLLRATRRSSHAVLAAVLVTLLIIALVATVFAVNAWLTMIIWGAFGSTLDVRGQWRTIGYGQAIIVSVALWFVGGFFKKSS